jgi:hypothetical protein
MRIYLLPALVLGLLAPATSHGACCYFSAKNADILQPAQKVFITWDDKEKVESFTVQPKFEGNAADFGMVIPTPAKPKLDEMALDDACGEQQAEELDHRRAACQIRSPCGHASESSQHSSGQGR